MSNLLINQTVTMFYYTDLTPAKRFYGEILGLEAKFEDDWVVFYQITESSQIGLVLGSEKSYHQVQENNAAMLSMVTDDVDAWYDKVTADQTIPILRDINNSANAPVRGFIVADPGGYTVEFFQWI